MKGKVRHIVYKFATGNWKVTYNVYCSSYWCMFLTFAHIYYNCSIYQFLESFQEVAENNNFFDPGFSPQQMDHIPELYKSIIDDSAAIHDIFKQVGSKSSVDFYIIKRWEILSLNHVISNRYNVMVLFFNRFQAGYLVHQ